MPITERDLRIRFQSAGAVRKNRPDTIDTPYAPPRRKRPDFLFRITTEKLSDGSEVHNVKLDDLTFAATSLFAAEMLANVLVGAINEFSVNTAESISE